MPTEASRSTIGVAITIFIAILLKNPAAGVLASIGALYTGLAATSGVYISRIRAMAASGLMIGLAAALGALVAHDQALSVVTVLVVSFVLAMYASSSRIAGTMAAQTTAMLCVVIGLNQPPSAALSFGLLVWSGAAVQLFMLTVVWPMRTGVPERSAVAEAYEAMSHFALGLPRHRQFDAIEIPASLEVTEARELLNEAERISWQPEHDQLFQALRRAEAIRAALVGFAAADKAYAAIDRGTRVRADRILRSMARCFHGVAERARTSTLSQPPPVLKIPEMTGEGEARDRYQKWLKMVAGLIGDTCHPPGTTPPPPPRVAWRSAFTAITRLPDIQAVRSVTLQHAFRYAVTVDVAFYISQHWTRSHSYWLPVTVAIVLRQDYGTTFQKGLSRLFGTLLGLAISYAILKPFHPPGIVLQGLTLITTWFAFASIQASYLAATCAITGFVVFSISATGAAAGDVGYMRLVASIAGVLLALTSYALWPAWHWTQIWETLAKAAEAQTAYCRKLLRIHTARLSAETTGIDATEETDEARSVARSLRIQAEALVAATKVHPRGRNKQFQRIAEDASQQLEENAATILVAQAAWDADHPETDEQLRGAVAAAEALATQLKRAIR